MTEVCSICSKQNEKMVTLECEHSFGKDCLNAYILSNILLKGGDLPRCPYVACDQFISKEIIEIILYPNNLIKYNALTLNLEIAKSKNKRFCPKIDCGKVCDSHSGKCKCTCGFTFCSECGGELNDHHNCAKQNDIVRNEVGNNKKKEVMKCPKCKYLICKHSGCNLLTCVCKYKFCFGCGGAYSNSHYSGVLKCQGIYSEMSLQIFLLINIIILLVFPISLVGIGIWLCIQIAHTKLPTVGSKCRKICIIISFAIGMIAIFPITYGLLIVPFLVVQIIRVVVFSRRLSRRKRLFA